MSTFGVISHSNRNRFNREQQIWRPRSATFYSLEWLWTWALGYKRKRNFAGEELILETWKCWS